MNHPEDPDSTVSSQVVQWLNDNPSTVLIALFVSYSMGLFEQATAYAGGIC